jgi:hypothetical protein
MALGCPRANLGLSKVQATHHAGLGRHSYGFKEWIVRTTSRRAGARFRPW